MAYPYIQAAHYSGRQSRINRIVIHSTVSGTYCGGARDVAKYFASAAAGGSAHYTVDPCEIIQCLRENIIAWHAPPNTGSIGIELCEHPSQNVDRWDGDNRSKMLRLAARLTREVAERHNVPLTKLSPSELRAGKRGICGHVDVSKAFGQTDHWDPGAFPWGRFMSLVKGGAQEEDDMQLDELMGYDKFLTPWSKKGDENRNWTYEHAIESIWDNAYKSHVHAREMHAQVAGLVEAIKALSQPRGIDGDALVEQVQQATKRALADFEARLGDAEVVLRPGEETT